MTDRWTPKVLNVDKLLHPVDDRLGSASGGTEVQDVDKLVWRTRRP